MKETAVEWLENQLRKKHTLTTDDIKDIEEAKVRENQQKGYSEEEVLNILKARENYLENSPRNDLYVNIKDFFEKFKKN